jgi:hypothetical protein
MPGLQEARSQISSDEPVVRAHGFLSARRLVLALDASEAELFVNSLRSDEEKSVHANPARLALLNEYYASIKKIDKIDDWLIEKNRVYNTEKASLFSVKSGSVTPELYFNPALGGTMLYLPARSIATKSPEAYDLLGDLINLSLRPLNLSGIDKVIAGIVRISSEICQNSLLHALDINTKKSYARGGPDKLEVASTWGIVLKRRDKFSKSLIEDLDYYQEYKEYIDHTYSKTPRFVSCTIFDSGPGITKHYSYYKNRDLGKISDIIDGKLSSTNIRGAGGGLSILMREIAKNNGFVRIRETDKQLVAFGDSKFESDGRERAIAGTAIDAIFPLV